ncbi:hypothetical protein HPB48_000418 [Haemaphysalis longicornis]|uniref:Uncharacterized protein n=1 Tax=Haemaphysalis longicornis TaxID=44386 RepID=A0A9J6FEW7_HAELO|nr:hypothetical protein HPB48_000418 [Haemaphysalis longicornis]
MESGDTAAESPNLKELSATMFEKTGEYIQAELSSTLDDYRLTEEMNKLTITKYSDMKQIAGNVSKALKDLNEKCLRHHKQRLASDATSVTHRKQAVTYWRERQDMIPIVRCRRSLLPLCRLSDDKV